MKEQSLDHAYFSMVIPAKKTSVALRDRFASQPTVRPNGPDNRPSCHEWDDDLKLKRRLESTLIINWSSTTTAEG